MKGMFHEKGSLDTHFETKALLGNPVQLSLDPADKYHDQAKVP